MEIKKEIHRRQISSYEEIFCSYIPDTDVDQYSKAIRFYQSLNEENKKLFSYFVRKSVYDTASNIFAWLDGVYFLENLSKDLELKYEDETNKLNGYLQDIWLAIEDGADITELREFYKDF